MGLLFFCCTRYHISALFPLFIPIFMNKKLLILVVEDDVHIRNILQKKLTDQDFVVIMAHQGQEGVDMALAQHPDLIIMDIIMPRLDGLSAIRKLRVDTWGKSVPIIVFTNLEDEGYVSQAVQEGVNKYVLKYKSSFSDIVKAVWEILGSGVNK